MMERKHRLRLSMTAFALLVYLRALARSWLPNIAPRGGYYFDGTMMDPDDDFLDDTEYKYWTAVRRLVGERLSGPMQNEEFDVCGFPVGPAGEQALQTQRQYATCPSYGPDTPIVVLEGHLTFGRTANQLRSFLRAMQYARDNGYQLGIMASSWATDLILQFFLAGEPGTWEQRIEDTLCVKILHSPEEIEGRRVVLASPAELFNYRSPLAKEEYIASQLQILRTLFRHYNTASGYDHHDKRTADMCASIVSLFGRGSSTPYSVIHLRHQEGDPGVRWLASAANATGCDPHAALEMTPEYVKSILGPLGMLEHPIAIITDGQNPGVLKRLIADPEIGPRIRRVTGHLIGGDITLATMAKAFIGNPASTFSGFIAQARVALGMNENYLYRARDESGEWRTVCGDDCLFMAGRLEPGEEYAPPMASREMVDTMTDRRGLKGARLSVDQWQQRREDVDASTKLREMAQMSSVNTG